MKAVVAAFSQEKALVGAFSVITNLRMDLFEALLRGLFLEMCQHAMSRYDETLEVGIFGQLLDNEESRIKYRSLQVDMSSGHGQY